MEVRQFAEGCEIGQALLVRDAECRRRRDGTEYLKLTLGDKTGSVPAVIRDGLAEARELCRPGAILFVIGRYLAHPKFAMAGVWLLTVTITQSGQSAHTASFVATARWS